MALTTIENSPTFTPEAILDHDIKFYFKTKSKKFKKDLSSVLNTFE